MGIKLANNAFGTLAAGIASGATSITLTTGHGARFPTLSAGDYFYATLIDTSNNLEIVKVTARATDTMTVVRAQESTTARAYSAGDRIEIRLTAQTFVDTTNAVNSEYDNTTSGLTATNVQDAIDTIGKPATQTEMEAGTEAGLRSVSPLRVKQAIQALAPSPTISSTAQAQAGTDNTTFITPLRMREGFNATGSAPVFACRAWVNFNGTGTVAIRASGNVSSITDNGVGDYTVNFTTAMPDNNYIYVAPAVGNASSSYNWSVTDNFNNASNAKTATAHRVIVRNSYNGGAVDAAYAYLAYFR